MSDCEDIRESEGSDMSGLAKPDFKCQYFGDFGEVCCEDQAEIFICTKTGFCTQKTKCKFTAIEDPDSVAQGFGC